jgi:hypothetical protein
MASITNRERRAVLRSLAAGVTPAGGLQHIQVGRRREIEAVLADLEHVQDGAASVRFVVGRFGSGKSFFLNLVRHVALHRRFVVLQADVTTDRRLHGNDGQARALYAELIKNMATRSKPEGNALPNLVEKWIQEVDHSVRHSGGDAQDVQRKLAASLRPLQDLVAGFDFATVLTRYYEAYLSHDEALQTAALRWLRGEYASKMEARRDLGVRVVVEDDAVYDVLKLWAAFVRIAGYAGLVVNVDEMVVLSERLNHAAARNSNYEAILKIVNDCLQGGVSGLAFLFAGTPEFLEDRRRGLYSYEALATRLAPNRFESDGRVDMSGPVIRLQPLTAEDCHILLENVARVFAGGDDAEPPVTDAQIAAFLGACRSRLGAEYFLSPREVVKSFVGLLNVLEQNPRTTWNELLTPDRIAAPPRKAPEPGGAEDGENLAEFRL